VFTVPKHYYTSVIDGDRRGLLTGPFQTHAEALADVARAKQLAEKADRWAAFYGFGTAGSDDVLPVVFPDMEVSSNA
jgi:hypothetical protein